MNKSILLGTLLFVLGVVFALAQLWLSIWTPEIFIKLELTLGALLAIVYVVSFVRREYREHQETRNGDKLD